MVFASSETDVLSEQPSANLVPHACVVLTAGTPPDPTLAADLLAFARARLPAFKCPRSIEFVSDLPKTATGRIQRFRLRAPSESAGLGLGR